MNIKRIGRALICLLLIFCLILNIAPPKAEATGAGLAGTITAVSGVTVSAPLAIGAAAIALGVMAKNTNPLVFENMVNDAVASLSAAGKWVKDGTVELLQTIDETGQKAYYVAGDMLEDVRSWSLDAGIVQPVWDDVTDFGNIHSANMVFMHGEYEISVEADVRLFQYAVIGNDYVIVHSVAVGYNPGDFNWYYCGSPRSGTLLNDGSGRYYLTISTKSEKYGLNSGSYSTLLDIASSLPKSSFEYNAVDLIGYLGSSGYSVSDDLSIGVFPSVPVDGTSAREWSKEYTDRGLKVYGGGSGNNNNDGKWFWKVIIPTTAVTLYAMSQADQWSGETPTEFDDYSSVEEFEIVSRPEVEFGQGLEIAPATNPNPDPGTNPGTGGDSGSSGDTGSDGDSDSTGTDETTWFQRIVTGIEELPSKFQNWITDCKTAIEELPSKFADWFNKIIEILGNIWEWLQNLVSSLIDALKQLLVDLFAPSAEFIANKVNALCAKYPYLDTFLALGTDLKAYFLSLGTKPPIIYIDLGASRGSLPLGGRQAFIDLTWYAEYKPTMDAILGAFLWLWLAWRLFLSLPGLIQGFSGTYGSKNIEYERLPNMPKYQVGSNWLNSGSSYHKTGDWHHRDKVK